MLSSIKDINELFDPQRVSYDVRTVTPHGNDRNTEHIKTRVHRPYENVEEGEIMVDGINTESNAPLPPPPSLPRLACHVGVTKEAFSKKSDGINMDNHCRRLKEELHNVCLNDQVSIDMDIHDIHAHDIHLTIRLRQDQEIKDGSVDDNYFSFLVTECERYLRIRYGYDSISSTPLSGLSTNNKMETFP